MAAAAAAAQIDIEATMDRVDYESLIIQDLINFHQTKSLEISPWYQRRAVWSAPQKAYLINTIFEQKPVPSIYIRHQIDMETERSIKEVVDGQQRVRTVIEYRADGFGARHPNHRQKVRYSQLSANERRLFLSTALSVGYLIGADDSDVIEIFGRINSIAKTLNPQEKRNAVFSGEFKQFCLRQATERLAFWRNTGIFTATAISRMLEVQFVAELAINLMNGLQDYSSKAIDNMYKENDEEFAREDEASDRLDALFRKLAALDPKDFSDTVFRASQVAFSLMVVLDRLRDREIPVGQIHDAMHDVDTRVSGYEALDALEARESRILQGFTGGNLHRIRARAIRDEVIAEALA